jgi:hypothetical protein
MPNNYEIERHQKLLAMYRSLLAEYLHQYQQWHQTGVSGFLSTNINVLRRHIMETKGTLRGWKIAIDDHPDDQGLGNDIGAEIDHQHGLLKIHRRNLAAYLQQQQKLARGQVPPALINSLYDVRREIQRIKAILRGWGRTVDDLPEEEVEE